MEAIQIYYREVMTAEGKSAYHGTIVYTDNQGNQTFYAGDIGNSSMSQSERRDLWNAAMGEAAAVTGFGYDPYGNLVTVQGSVTDPAMAGYVDKWIKEAAGQSTILLSADLSGANAIISDVMTQINNLNLNYGPLTQNSNSAWCTAIVAAGLGSALDIYNQNSVFGDTFTPGCLNILPTTYTPSFPDPYQIFTVRNGDNELITHILETSPDGLVLNETTLDPSDEYISWQGTDSNGEVNYYAGGITLFEPADPFPGGPEDWGDFFDGGPSDGGIDPGDGGYPGDDGDPGDGGYPGDDGDPGDGGYPGGGGDPGDGGGGGGGNPGGDIGEDEGEYPERSSVRDGLTDSPAETGKIYAESKASTVRNAAPVTGVAPTSTDFQVISSSDTTAINVTDDIATWANLLTGQAPFIADMPAVNSPGVDMLIQSMSSFAPAAMSGYMLVSDDVIGGPPLPVAAPWRPNQNAQL